MALSDSSALSTPPSSDGEEDVRSKPIVAKTLKLKGGKLTAASIDESPLSSPEPSPPPREPTPPHEYVLADNPDVAFLVMFRSRFSDLFPKNVPNLGPQDIENGVVGSVPSEQIENFLCALLGLVLNRKKYVERGHHGRALEEAISTQKHQWPRSWGGSNPLPGTRTFTDMDPTERLALLRTLVHWALNTSEAISAIIKESYKQARHDDDLNQPLSVQPWGADGRKRRYWLIEGQNDTPFRLYQENPPKLVHRTWWSIAGDLDELKAAGETLRAENTQAGRRLADSFNVAIPRLEETLEKRKRKEYRQARRAAFSRPEPGHSLYEGRTRGRRMKYTFSDNEDEDTSDADSVRRSTRHHVGSTSTDVGGPTITSSGRQVRSRFGRSYGDPMEVDVDNTTHATGRPRRAAVNGLQQTARSGSNTDDEMSDGDDEAASSGEEWGGNGDDVEGEFDEDDEDQVSDDESEDSVLDRGGSLVVTLKYRKDAPNVANESTALNGTDADVAQSPAQFSGHHATILQPPAVAPTTTEPIAGSNGPISDAHQTHDRYRQETSSQAEQPTQSTAADPALNGRTPSSDTEFYPDHSSPPKTYILNPPKASQAVHHLPSVQQAVAEHKVSALQDISQPHQTTSPRPQGSPMAPPQLDLRTPLDTQTNAFPAQLNSTNLNGHAAQSLNRTDPENPYSTHQTHSNGSPATGYKQDAITDKHTQPQQQDRQSRLPPPIHASGPSLWSNQ